MHPHDKVEIPLASSLNFTINKNMIYPPETVDYNPAEYTPLIFD